MTIDDLTDPNKVYDALSAAHESGHAVLFELHGISYHRGTLEDEIGPARVEVGLIPITVSAEDVA